LNSRLSSFSTADRRSAIVSYSTKLCMSVLQRASRKEYAPPAVAFPADLGVDNVQSGLARKVFQILESRVSPSSPEKKVETSNATIQAPTTARLSLIDDDAWTRTAGANRKEWCREQSQLSGGRNLTDVQRTVSKTRTFGAQRGDANLPTGLDGKASDGHLVRSATRTRRRPFMGMIRFTAGTFGELHYKTLTHELCSVCTGS